MKLKLNIRDRIREAADSDNMLTFEACVDVDNLFEMGHLPDEQELDLHDLLAEEHAIALIWDTGMLLSHYPHLSEEQAWDVLQECERNYNAEHGLTWDDVTEVISERYPDPEDFLMPERIARCEKALEPYTDSDEVNLTDLLADLMHWSRRRGHAFGQALETARTHFEHEGPANRRRP
jgi:hypothetical protein